MNQSLINQLLEAAAAAGIDSIAVNHRSQRIVTAHQYPYQMDQPHVMYSATKSVVSLLIGQLLDDGKLDLHQNVLDFFPEITPQNPSDNKSAMTLYHLLTMTTGHDVDSVEPIMRSQNPNWTQAFLDLPVPLKPGSRFVYDSGASYILTAMMDKVVEGSVRDFADQRLLGPLGITDYHWQTCPRGIHIGGWGLYLTTEQMMTLGEMLLHQGVHQGTQLVSAAYIQDATSNHIPVYDDDPNSLSYGYQFWETPSGYQVAGMGGQKIYIAPDHDVVAVMTTSGLDDMNSMPDVLLADYILPAVAGGEAVSDAEAARTQTLIDAMAQAPVKQARVIPEQIQEIDGRTFTFEDSPLHSLKLAFQPDQCEMDMEYTDIYGMRHSDRWNIGLDNQYRTSARSIPHPEWDMYHYKTLYCRGRFTGCRVMEVEMRLPGELPVARLQVIFHGNQLRLRTINQSSMLLPDFDAVAKEPVDNR